MTTPRWDDPVVAATLREVVQDLGRRTALDPARLRAALNDSLGSRAQQHRAQVDVLAVAVEEGVPQGIVEGSDAGLLRGRLTDRDVREDVAEWVLATWSDALGIRTASPLPPTAVPPTALPPTALPPTALPPTALPPASPPPVPRPPASGGPTSPPPVPGPGPAPAPRRPAPPTSLPPTSLPTPASAGPTGSSPLRRLVLVAVVVVLAAVLTTAAVLVRRSGTPEAVPSPARRRRSASASASSTPRPAGTATPARTPGPGPAQTPASVDRPLPTVLAHEGGTERFASETAESLVDAARRGYGAETDVQWTSDGVAVLSHDATTHDPMDCGRSYEIAKTTWATLRARCRTTGSPDGKRYRMPRFDDVVGKVAAVPDAQLFAEVKVEQDPKQVAGFATILQERGMVGRTVITSFFPAELAKMRRSLAGSDEPVRLMQFVRNTKELSPAAARKAGLWAVAIRKDAVDARYVAALHDEDLVVVVWTPNETTEWALARKARADLVLTDRPTAYVRWKS